MGGALGVVWREVTLESALLPFSTVQVEVKEVGYRP
ncbi:hypothetical protein HKBW3S03_01875, partial [Candidatus Hakubella thermalkaliphila]